MDMMGFGYRLYPSYDGYNGVCKKKATDKIIDQWIAEYDELPPLTIESETNEIHANYG